MLEIANLETILVAFGLCAIFWADQERRAGKRGWAVFSFLAGLFILAVGLLLTPGGVS